MNWKYTHIHHAFRNEVGLSLNEYAVLDIFYQCQSHPSSTKDGWAAASYEEVGDFLGLTKAAVFSIVELSVSAGLMEIDSEKSRLKKTLPDWYDYAYLESKSSLPDKNTLLRIKCNIKNARDERSQNVQKMNEKNVQKMNEKRSKNERSTLVVLNNNKIKEKSEVSKTENALSKTSTDKKTLTEKVKALLAKPYMLQTCRDYGSKDRLKSDLITHMLDENFVYENDAMLASYIKGFVKRKATQRNEPTLQPELLQQVEKYLPVLNQRPYCDRMKPIRDFEIRKVAQAISDGLRFLDWKVLVDRLCSGDTSPEFCTVSYGVGKFWEENKGEIQATANLIQRR